MINNIVKLVKTLNSDDSPAQISAGLVMGMLVGLTPLWSLHNLLFFFLVCVLRFHIAAFFLSFAFFSGIAYLAAPAMVAAGESLLTNESLIATWTAMYQVDIWRLAHFNHTLTLGSLVTGLALSIPLFFIFKVLIVKYRDSILEWVRKSHLVQTLKASTWFIKLKNLYTATER